LLAIVAPSVRERTIAAAVVGVSAAS
jgi:hypothetical protein